MQRQQWEYLRLRTRAEYSGALVVDMLNNEALPHWPAWDEYANRLGADGWELVGMEGVSQFFKRARPPDGAGAGGTAST